METVVDARHDGHADWYDATFRCLGDEAGSAGLLGRLLGPAEVDDPVCLDIGCGTGLHFEAVAARGYTVIGVDVSSDQLRFAASRSPRVIQADAGRLPLSDASVPAVAMTFIHTDGDDLSISDCTRPMSAPSSTGRTRSRTTRCTSWRGTAMNGCAVTPVAGSRCAAGSVRAT